MWENNIWEEEGEIGLGGRGEVEGKRGASSDMRGDGEEVQRVRKIKSVCSNGNSEALSACTGVAFGKSL